ncbi:MAG: permease [Anaerorhabdus sp.]|uniref:permease n=1 Tax=Anaerorhabdus sp. TaxID=1872524 RepID=UPI003A8B9E65
MKMIKKARDNIFLIVVAAAYILMFIISPDMGVISIKNSSYYIKEMLIIMPVIFVLTALLDTWVAKEKITKYLGKESKVKGIILSFVLGSISAGPIYAAFPMCVMLHKKGASVRNLVIILSSWAVIKVPMLLNEVKFLGIKFMAIRWVLTVISIVVFSWITSKIVKDKDIVQKEEKASGLTLNREACMGCTLCTKNYPEIFGMQGKKAYIKSFDSEIDKERLNQTISTCPVKAINYNE